MKIILIYMHKQKKDSHASDVFSNILNFKGNKKQLSSAHNTGNS